MATISMPAVTATRTIQSSYCSNKSLSASSSSFTSVQFPVQLQRFQIGNKRRFPFTSRRPILPLVQARKQSFSSFDDLLKNSDKPVLVDFYATWCGPCQFMGPVLSEVSAKLVDTIQVVKIDTEKYPSIANKYQIAALPTFIIFKDGKPHHSFLNGHHSFLNDLSPWAIKHIITDIIPFLMLHKDWKVRYVPRVHNQRAHNFVKWAQSNLFEGILCSNFPK